MKEKTRYDSESENKGLWNENEMDTRTNESDQLDLVSSRFTTTQAISVTEN